MNDLDLLERKHNQAIRRGIGERLRALLSRDAADVPPRLGALVGRLDDDQASSTNAPAVPGRRSSIIDRLVSTLKSQPPRTKQGDTQSICVHSGTDRRATA
jgi:hypothetical protein